MYRLTILLFCGLAPLLSACLPSTEYLTEASKRLEAQRIALDRLRLEFSALDAASNEDYDTAIKLLTRAIETEGEPKEKASTYRFRADVYANALRFDQALADFAAALQLDPNEYYAHTGQGRIYGSAGNYDRAFAAFDAAIRLDEKNGVAYRDRGEVYIRQREYDRALADFDKAIALSQAYPLGQGLLSQPVRKFPLAYMSRGWANFYMEQFSTAAADFMRALEQSKQAAEPVIWLYLARLRGGQEGAAELQQNARQLNLQKWPGPVVDHFLRAAGENAIFEALKHPDPTIENDRRCKVYFYLGQYALANNDRSEAVKLFTAALKTGMAHSVEYFGVREELERLKR